MRIRTATLLYCGIIPRMNDFCASVHRQWWAHRLIYEYTRAPLVKARATVCR